MKTYVTERGLGKRLPMPLRTLQRRLRVLGLTPDGVTVEAEKRASVHLYAVERLPELRAALIASGPETEVRL